MAYNPGITYQGGEYIARGISQFGDAVKDGLRQYVQNKEQDQFLTQRAESLAPALKKYAAYGELADESGPGGQMFQNLSNFANLPLAKKKAAVMDAEQFISQKEAQQRRNEDNQYKLFTMQHQQTQEELARQQFEMMKELHGVQMDASRQQQAENVAVGQALQRYATPQFVPDPAAALESPIGQLSRFARATRQETDNERRLAAIQMLPGGRGTERVFGMLEKLAPKTPTELDAAHAAFYRAKAEESRNPDAGWQFDPSKVTALGSGMDGFYFVPTSRGGGQVVSGPEALKARFEATHFSPEEREAAKRLPVGTKFASDGAFTIATLPDGTMKVVGRADAFSQIMADRKLPGQTPASPGLGASVADWFKSFGGAAPAGSTNAPATKSPLGNAPKPKLPAVRQLTTQSEIDDALAQANEAIKQGKDPALVRKRLEELGIQLRN